ncbi:MAG TPA: hypothetical protein VK796_01610 [Cytophaga sp.]|jgi:hypothetical protein|nr:hypothetical protein [Cytophaga sp.]
MKNAGILIIIVGALMIAYTGFTFITKKKVVDAGPIQISKEEKHPVQWSPIVGVILVIGGVAMLVTNKNN